MDPRPTIGFCPACRAESPYRLAAGELCASCRSQDAWARVEAAGPLVIGRTDVDDMVRRRDGAAARSKWLRFAQWVPAAVAVTLGAVAVVAIADLHRHREIASLAVIVTSLRSAAYWAMGAGAGACASAIVGLAWIRRSRTGRRLGLLVASLLGVVAGSVGFLYGALASSQLSDVGMAHLQMPALPATIASDVDRQIMAATVIIIAPDRDGNAGSPTIGTGAIVATEPDRCFVATNSHVAVPWIAPGASRDVDQTTAVWVELSDGRGGLARVRWLAPPPIDVALLEIPLGGCPSPVPVSDDLSGLPDGASVRFVANPLRSGWRPHAGRLVRTEDHTAALGTYSVLFSDLPVQPGDSGSGLFDSRGQLIGLNTWSLSSVHGPQGVGLSADTVREILAEIRGRDAPSASASDVTP